MRTARDDDAGDAPQRSGGARRPAVALLATTLACGWFADCISPATEAICVIATDVPTATQLTIRVQASVGASIGDAPSDYGWITAADGGMGITLPASFAIVPPPGEDAAVITIVVEALGAGFTLRRVARVQLIANATLYVPVFLARSCANAASGCTTVPASMCTVEQYCEERNMSCGESGECVALDDGTSDASVIDVTATDIGSTPDVGPCGAASEPCCGGVTCMGTNLVCLATSCVPCGPTGSPCCAGSVCNAGSECASGTCSAPPCGAIGESCCAGGTCNAGLECASGVCRTPCGATGQACCAGGACNAGLECASGSCRTPCGAVGLPCCAGDACNAGENCLTGMCYACGAHDQTCCLAGTACGASLTCVGTGFGPICECGAVGQVCCGGTTCNAGGNCVSGSCSACGANEHTCCFTGTACSDGTSQCYGTGFGPLCGFPAYTPCSSADWCEPGFTCASTSHGTICCGSPGTGCSASWQCCGSTLCISGTCN